MNYIIFTQTAIYKLELSKNTSNGRKMLWHKRIFAFFREKLLLSDGAIDVQDAAGGVAENLRFL